ncbi:PrsW family intramembrane metalloprotease [bacterium]|nr:PrsW family intramembrane metalloprotease [bacterium]
MTYFLYIILGFLPSIVWLLFYLRKDSHPEPNSMVIRIFIWGMMISPLAIVLEFFLIWLINPYLSVSEILTKIPTSVVGILLSTSVIPAVVEEYLKYSVVKYKVLKNPEFDEPLDAMLYCIIAALGFAAVENLLILLKTPLMPIPNATAIILIRFLGATFLHGLSSGIVGYYLSQGLLFINKKNILITKGLIIAIIFHTAYNYFIVNIHTLGKFSVIGISILLISMAFIVSGFFKQLKTQLSICNLKNY